MTCFAAFLAVMNGYFCIDISDMDSAEKAWATKLAIRFVGTVSPPMENSKLYRITFGEYGGLPCGLRNVNDNDLTSSNISLGGNSSKDAFIKRYY